MGPDGIVENVIGPLATAAASHPHAPATLAEAGEPLAFELGRGDFERVREQVDALREYC